VDVHGLTNCYRQGYKVDIRHGTTVDNYIKTAFTRIANRGDGYPQWQSAAGNIYCVSHGVSIDRTQHSFANTCLAGRGQPLGYYLLLGDPFLLDMYRKIQCLR